MQYTGENTQHNGQNKCRQHTLLRTGGMLNFSFDMLKVHISLCAVFYFVF